MIFVAHPRSSLVIVSAFVHLVTWRLTNAELTDQNDVSHATPATCASLIAGEDSFHKNTTYSSTLSMQLASPSEEAGLHLLQRSMHVIRTRRTIGGWSFAPVSTKAPKLAKIIFGKSSARARTDKWFHASEIDPRIKPGSQDDKGMLVRVINRPAWQKTTRCKTDAPESCEECSAPPDCWMVKDSNNRMSVTAGTGNPHATVRGFRRFLSTLHIRCVAPVVHIRFNLFYLQGGSLRFFWDGKEITQANGFQATGFQSPLQVKDFWAARKEQWKKYNRKDTNLYSGLGAAIVELDNLGGHDFTVEFTSNPSAPTAKAMISGLSFFMTDTFAKCEDTKACLTALGNSTSGLKLRNSNVLQRLCLMSSWNAMSPEEKQACVEWRHCLSESDEDHSERLLTFLNAAGVGGGGTAMTPAIPDNGEKNCIYPTTADPESWDCDCFRDMYRRCQLLEATHGFTFGKNSMVWCMRALFCANDAVCSHWKSQTCGHPLVQNFQHMLQVTDESKGSQNGLMLLGKESLSYNTSAANEEEKVKMRVVSNTDEEFDEDSEMSAALYSRQSAESSVSRSVDGTVRDKACM
eukprot:gnl/TRDRNA2_/TRDRNA2_175388_c0_seq5.p1 gnl/TRDRNA2_/TRDRNA2_175388_c0~~gnl/TRDRNA2_/TRDRNA2_175388_c0_seq5.p1  ORF type:complete len:577 (+),score=66.88 gnl/TRDRNA2_/TRDRNA2_175388_c0_seq5:67-1797(+)